MALAAVAGDAAELTAEAADLIYHMLVLLAGHDLGLAELTELLAARHRSS